MLYFLCLQSISTPICDSDICAYDFEDHSICGPSLSPLECDLCNSMIWQKTIITSPSPPCDICPNSSYNEFHLSPSSMSFPNPMPPTGNTLNPPPPSYGTNPSMNPIAKNTDDPIVWIIPLITTPIGIIILILSYFMDKTSNKVVLIK